MKKRGIAIAFYAVILLLTFQLSQTTTPVYAATALTAPKSVKAVSSSYNSTTISWNNVTGAKGYEVYRATSSSGKYSRLASITSKGYKDTKLVTGNTYYYMVRAYYYSGKTKKYGAYSSKVSIRVVPSTPSSVTGASYTYNSVTICWNGVSGASGYSVYRASIKSGTYTLLQKTTAKSYKSTGLTTGTSYYYKVRAYRKMGSGIVYGNYTSVVTAKPLPQAVSGIQSEETSDNSITIKWSGVSGADGYAIYQAESAAGAYKLLGSTPGTSLVNNGLTPGTSYYYKIRTYKIVHNTKVYGNYSSVVNFKTSGIEVTSVGIDQGEVTLNVGETAVLNAVILPADATDQTVSWSSTDNSIVSVDSTGVITAVGAGNAFIIVTAKDGNLTAQCTVTINADVDTPPEAVELQGIDVSKWQGKIDWSLVKNAGIQFAMIRASYGSSSTDPMFEANYQNAKANNIALGAYHYSYATTVEKASIEVDYFLSILEGKQFEYPICIDVEDSSMRDLADDTLADIVLVYLTKLTDAGYYPIIYSNKSWFTNKLNDERLSEYDHWLAEWSALYTYQGAVGIWQYSSQGKVDGINTNVDLDISYYDYESYIKSHHLNGF